ncbi:MAG: hypothetical protein ABWZ08_12775 [Pseudoxanthomonas sp.]
MTLRCLFVDFDSYFASVEQFDHAHLRGQPVGVIPVDAEGTCCIAASHEAKRFGVKTGTSVRDAREQCPDIQLVLARPARYVEVHQQLMDAIQECIPHQKPESIDEVPCRLMGRERERGNAEAIARGIKRRLVERGFDHSIHCSIGIAPNQYLAKTASDMEKPNGLTVIELADLPDILYPLELRDLCGIGPSMETRLRQAGIHTVRQLCAATPRQLRAVWGSVEGERFWAGLHGVDLPARATQTSSIGHSHVLGPELRTPDGARSVAFKLLAKAAMRLRDKQYLAGALHAHVRFLGQEQRLDVMRQFAPIDDTRELLRQLGEMLEPLAQRPRKPRRDPHPPLSIAVTLSGLQPRGAESGSLFESPRESALNGVLDRINQRYGNNKLYFGAMQQALMHNAAPMRIPFSVVPDIAREEEADHELWLQAKNRFNRQAEETHRQQSSKPRKPPAS